MSFVTKNLGWVADNVFGMDRPQLPATPTTNTAIQSQLIQKNSNITAPASERSRSDAGAAYGAGQSGIALDPLGRKGAGFVSSHKSLLGR